MSSPLHQHTTVLTHMALAVIGATVGMATAALLMIGYMTLAPTGDAAPVEMASAEEHRGLQVRTTIGEPHNGDEAPQGVRMQ